MNKWIKSILVALLMTGLAFVLYVKIFPSGKSQLYNVHYVLGSIQELGTKRDLLGEAPAMIKERITELGYASFVGNVGNNRLDILVENVTDTLSLRQVVLHNVENRQIEFRELYTLDELPGLFEMADKVSYKVFKSAKRKDVGIYSIMSPLVSEDIEGESVLPAAIASLSKKDTAILNQILHEKALLDALPPDVKFYFGRLTNQTQLNNMPDELHLYAIKTRNEPARLQNRDIAKAEANSFELHIRFDDNGRAKLAVLTRDNIQRYLAVILDNVVVMAPRVYQPITNGRISVEGDFSPDDITELASQLATNYLPAGFAIVKEEISSKTIHNSGKLIVLLLVTFILSAGLALVLFNYLKNS